MGRTGAKDLDCRARDRALMIQRASEQHMNLFRAYASPLLEIIAGVDVSMVPVEQSKTLL